MSKKGSLVIISGFSGAGKGTVVKELMKNYECYALSISATTRNPRPGEENGREYFFKTKEEIGRTRLNSSHRSQSRMPSSA